MKKIILTVALLLPIGVFVFLFLFGKNEFSIPVYYENATDIPPTACGGIYQSPYHVSDSLLVSLGWQGNTLLIAADSSRAVHLALKRMRGELNQDLQTVFLSEVVQSPDQIYSCDLFLQAPWNTVLLDNQRRIRGYYDLSSREEVDRLIVELKILLKQY